MATDVRPEPDQTSLTNLVSGILNDARDLMKQQVALFRAEVREDFKRTRRAGTFIGIGAGVALLGVLMTALMLVFLLHWAVEPALPLWACFGIVGATLLAIAGGLCYQGKTELESFNPLPDQSLQALEENVRWTTPR